MRAKTDEAISISTIFIFAAYLTLVAFLEETKIWVVMIKLLFKVVLRAMMADLP